MMDWIGSTEVWYTLGPASLGSEFELIEAGATAVRLTFSFGTPDLQHERAEAIKAAEQRAGRRCTVIADLAGEKFRLGTFDGEHTIFVTRGTVVRFVCAQSANPSGDRVMLPVPNPRFLQGLRKGHVVTVGDGAAILEITSAGPDYAIGEARGEGTINNNRGLTVQGSDFVPSALTEKDLADLRHILPSNVYDAVAVSFVSSAEPIIRVKEMATSLARRPLPVIAKIETGAGVEAVAEIARAADCIMAARGDLALAIPWVELPDAVSRMSSAAKQASRPWILATQVMEGLERFAIPTRAEICDLAHWCQEGCAGVLLSYETAFGKRPIEAVACAAKIVRRWSGRTR